MSEFISSTALLSTGYHRPVLDFADKEHELLGLHAPVLAHALADWQETDMSYVGDFGHVIHELDAAMENRRMAGTALYAARLTRGVIDTKIDNPDLGISFDAVRLVSGLTLEILKGEATQADVQQVLIADGLADVPLTALVQQESDSITRDATNPMHINMTVKQLEETIGGADMLCIPLCHGSLLAAAGTYIRKEARRVDDSWSMFYPVRFSIHKLEDDEPQVTEEEIEGLRNALEDRELIIMDEDSSYGMTEETGQTVKKARTFFKRVLGRTPTFAIVQNGMIIKD